MKNVKSSSVVIIYSEKDNQMGDIRALITRLVGRDNLEQTLTALSKCTRLRKFDEKTCYAALHCETIMLSL